MQPLTTRELYLQQVRLALDLAERKLQVDFANPNIKARIVNHTEVRRIARAWNAKLRWNVACQRATAIHRSCFVGIFIEDVMGVMALIRVSDSSVATTLLFVEKDDNAQAFGPGDGMAMTDVVLTAVANTVGSARIVIDEPYHYLIDYYSRYGYRAIDKPRRRGRFAMEKAV